MASQNFLDQQCYLNHRTTMKGREDWAGKGECICVFVIFSPAAFRPFSPVGNLSSTAVENSEMIHVRCIQHFYPGPKTPICLAESGTSYYVW